MRVHMSHKCISLEFKAGILFKREKIFTYIPSHCIHDVLCNVKFPRCSVMTRKILICQFASEIGLVDLTPRIYALFQRCSCKNPCYSVGKAKVGWLCFIVLSAFP